MLKDNYQPKLAAIDLQVYEKLVPANHYLRRLKTAIDFTACRALVADCYSPGMGRGAIDPVLLLKLQVLEFHYGLSDERVIQEAQVNAAYRFFLDLPLDAVMPEPSLLSQFRTRLGVERFQSVFHEILRQAREAGLVKDRLRLKDATHVLANIAAPATIQLVAQIRTRILETAECFAREEVAMHRRQAEEIRQSTTDLKDEARLLRRVEHLRELVAWGDGWLARLLESSEPLCTEKQREAFATALELGHKVLKDREPKSGDKLISLQDPDARSGKHGEYYDGYLLDLSIDSDSELICGVDALPANADEAANAKTLIEQEEAAHGNDIECLSIDAVGYNGAVLKSLSDEETGPQVTVYVPPKQQPPRHPELFQSEDFKLNEAGDELTCPQGETTRKSYRDNLNHGQVFYYRVKQCRDCPLRAQCILAGNKLGRKVYKNDFIEQYKAAQQRATTDEYKQIRKEHPKVERKLNEMVRWHAGRHVRYRHRFRVKVQYLLLAIVVNCKRIVRLLSPAPTPQNI